MDETIAQGSPGRQQVDVVESKPGVGCEQGKPLNLSLSDQQTVEGISLGDGEGA
jgi:hypothetical protein